VAPTIPFGATDRDHCLGLILKQDGPVQNSALPGASQLLTFQKEHGNFSPAHDVQFRYRVGGFRHGQMILSQRLAEGQILRAFLV